MFKLRHQGFQVDFLYDFQIEWPKIFQNPFKFFPVNPDRLQCGDEGRKDLFPEKFNLNASDAEILKEIIDDINLLGFDISEFSDNTFVVNGTPADLCKINSLSFIESLIENYKNNKSDIKNDIRENVVRSIAKASAINYGKTLTVKEMSNLIDCLFACKTPNYSPSGKSVFNIINIEELDKRFKN